MDATSSHGYAPLESNEADEARYISATVVEQNLESYLEQLPPVGAEKIRQEYADLSSEPRHMRVTELALLARDRMKYLERYLESLSDTQFREQHSFLTMLLSPDGEETAAWHMRVHELAVKGRALGDAAAGTSQSSSTL